MIYVKKIKSKVFFENLTMVPIDKELINFNLLNKMKKLFIKLQFKNLFEC